MKSLKRSIAMLLAVLMLAGLLPAGVIAEELPTVSVEEPEKQAGIIESDPILFPETLTPGEPKAVSLTAGKAKALQFTPESDGYYAFFSQGDTDPRAELYSEGNFLCASDDEGKDNNFYINYQLTAGKTYELKVWFCDSEFSGTFPVTLVKRDPATALNFSVDNIKKVAVKAFFDLVLCAGPENEAIEDVEIKVENEDVLRYEYSDYEYDERKIYVGFTALSSGSTTVTAKTGSGLTSTVEITVLPAAPYTLGETRQVTVPADEWGYSVLCTVTEAGVYQVRCENLPEETGWYTKFIQVETESYVYPGENNQFSLEPGTYYCHTSLTREPGMATTFDFTVNKLLPATAVHVTNEVLVGVVGDTFHVDCEFSPENAIKESYTLTSDNPTVAIPEENETYLHLLSAGTANITVTTQNGLTDTFTLTVSDLPAAEYIYLNHEGTDAYVGVPLQLYVSRDPDISAVEEITWTVTDPELVTVSVDEFDSEYAKFIFSKTGLYTVTAKNESGLTAGCSVTVNETLEFSDTAPLPLSFYNYQTAMAKFTVSEDGWYRIFSEEISSNDLYLIVYDENMEELVWSNGGSSVDFDFEKDRTYYVNIHLSLEEETSFTLKTMSLVPATSFSFSTDSIAGTVHSEFELEWVFGPENAARESLHFELADDSIAEVYEDDFNAVRFHFYKAGTTTFTATTSSGLTATATVTVTEPEALSPGEPKTATVSYERGVSYAFIPEEDGYYTFTFANSDYCSTIIFDDQGNQLSWIDAMHFDSQLELSQGNKYYVSIIPYRSAGSCECTVTIEKALAPTRLEFEFGDSMIDYVGEELYLEYRFGPEGCYGEEVTFTSSHPDVVEITGGAWIYLKAAGTAQVTITSESGLTDIITVISKEIPRLQLDTNTSATINPDTSEYTALFTFTPEEDDVYSLHLSDAQWIYYDVEGDDLYSGGNFQNDSEIINFRLSKDVEYTFAFSYDSAIRNFNIKITKALALETMEIAELPELTDYVEGFEDFYFDGLALRGTLAGGEPVSWECNGSSNYMGGYEVEIESIYNDGQYEKTVVTCGGKTAEFTLNIHENPVERLELVQGTIMSYVENHDGYYNSNWFFYYVEQPNDAMVKIHYKDGSYKTVSFMDEIDYHYTLEWSHNQYEKHWKAGTNETTISYLGKEVILPITVHPNPVESIEYLGDTIEILEHSNGYFNEDGSFYYFPKCLVNASLRVNYKDGSHKTLPFIDSINRYITVDYETHQEEKPWVPGNIYYVDVDYHGASCKIPVTVKENGIDRLELLSAPTAEYYYGDTLYGWMDGEDYYISSLSNTEGLSFRIHYENGSYQDVSHSDLTEELSYNGAEITIDPVENGPHTVGTVPAVLRFFGKALTYDVSLVKSPVSSLEVVELPASVVEDDWQWPDVRGTKIKINYANGTHKTVTFAEENTHFTSPDSPVSYVKTDGSILRIFYDYERDSWIATLMDCTVKLDIPWQDVPAVAKLDLIKFDPDLEGTRVLATYEDGSTQNITLGKVLIKYAEGNFSYGYISSPNGMTFFNWTEYSDVRNYGILTIHNSRFIIPLSSTDLPGDLDENGEVDLDDAIYLLYHVNFSSKYPLSQSADFNSDGNTDLDDAIYLLYHVNFPNKYPLN